MATRAFYSTLLLLVLVGPAFAASSGPMTIEGTLVVNGAPARAGLDIDAIGADGGVVAMASTGEGGAFRLTVPADDASTPAREGAGPGEVLDLRVAGRVVLRTTFHEGEVRTGLQARALLPDVAFGGAHLTPSEVAEGGNVSVQGVVVNRGWAPASLVRVVLSAGSTPLGSIVVGQVSANGSGSFGLAFGTEGLAGDQVVVATLIASEPDAHVTNDAAYLALRVRADSPPIVRAFSVIPPAPRANESVKLAMDVSDDEGIARVVFHWEAPDPRARLVQGPPYEVPIGAFAEGTRVRFWAVITEEGPDARATTTPIKVFEVRGSPPVAEEPRAAPSSPTVADDADDGRATPGVGAALLVVLVTLLVHLRRKR